MGTFFVPFVTFFVPYVTFFVPYVTFFVSLGTIFELDSTPRSRTRTTTKLLLGPLSVARGQKL